MSKFRFNKNRNPGKVGPKSDAASFSKKGFLAKKLRGLSKEADFRPSARNTVHDIKLLEAVVQEPYLEAALESYSQESTPENLRKLVVFDAFEKPELFVNPQINLDDIAGFYSLFEKPGLSYSNKAEIISDELLSTIILLFRQEGDFGYEEFGTKTSPAVIKQTVIQHYFTKGINENIDSINQSLIEPLNEANFNEYKGLKLLLNEGPEAAESFLREAGNYSANTLFLLAQARISSGRAATDLLSRLEAEFSLSNQAKKKLGKLYLQQELTPSIINYFFDTSSELLVQLGLETEKLPSELHNLFYRAFCESALDTEEYTLKKLELQKLTGRKFTADAARLIQTFNTAHTLDAVLALVPEDQLKEFEYELENKGLQLADFSDAAKRSLAEVCLKLDDNEKAADYLNAISEKSPEDRLKLSRAMVLSSDYDMHELFELLDTQDIKVSPLVSLALADFAYNQANFEASIRHYRQFFDAESTPQSLKHYAIANYKLKNYKEANDTFNLIEPGQLNPEELFARLATMFQLAVTEDMDYNEIISFADVNLPQDLKQRAGINYIIGRSYLETSRKQLALSYLKQAKEGVRKDKKNLIIEIDKSLIRTYDELGIINEGIEELNELHNMQPSNYEISLKLADTLKAMRKKPKRVEKLYNQLIEESEEFRIDAELGLAEHNALYREQLLPEIGKTESLSETQTLRLYGLFSELDDTELQGKLLLNIIYHSVKAGLDINALQSLDTMLGDINQIKAEPRFGVLEPFYKDLYEQDNEAYAQKLNQVLFMLDRADEVVPVCTEPV